MSTRISLSGVLLLTEEILSYPYLYIRWLSRGNNKPPLTKFLISVFPA